MAKPAVANIDLLMQMGLMPLCGGELTKGKGKTVYGSVLQAVRVLDEQNHLSRFSWSMEAYYGIDDNLVERILYYRGSGILWYHDALEKFMFTPYVGKGLDVYGRYTKCIPLPFTGSTIDEEGTPYIPGLELTPVYDIQLEAPDNKSLKDKCIIFYDYSKQLANKPIPRQQLNEPICRAISECIPFTRTTIINNTGITGYRVADQSDVGDVEEANDKILEAALSGKRWVALKNGINSEELSSGSGTAKVQDTLLVMEAFDNFRLSTHGIDNGGIFKKKSHMLESEQAMNNQDSSSVITDCLWNRRHACELAMSLYGLYMWCDISQSQAMYDRDMDGQLDTDQESPIEESVSEEVIE
jgi:hypothetical protein